MTTSSDRLQRQLHEQTAGLTMSVPVDDVLARGSRMRRRRRATVGAVAFAAVAALGAASVIAPSGTTPLVPQAQAAWGGPVANLSTEMVAEARTQCAPAVDQMGGSLNHADLVAGDSRNGETIAVFATEKQYMICDFNGATVADLRQTGATLGDRKRLPHGVFAKFVSATYAQANLDDPITDGAGAFRVADNVERLTIDFDGTQLDAAIGNGLGMFWMPDGIVETDFSEAIVTAYDSDGNVLSSERIH